MKLLTKEIKKRLAKYPIYSQDGKGKEAMCVAVFFFPAGAWTWYILEGNVETDDCFGIIINGYGEGEYGYISVDELQSIRVHGLRVERDIYFKPKQLIKDIHDNYLRNFLSKFDD